MKFLIKSAGAWKQARKIFIKQGTTWKQVKKVFVKTGGAWKQTYTSSSAPPPTEFATVNNKYTVSPQNSNLENGANAAVGVVPDHGGTVKGVLVLQQYNSGKVSISRWICAIVYNGTPDAVPTITTSLRLTNVNTGISYDLNTGPLYDSGPNETVFYVQIDRDPSDDPYPPNPFEGFIRNGMGDTFRITEI